MKIVHLRPNLSPAGPAKNAPKNPPPVKTLTTAPAIKRKQAVNTQIEEQTYFQRPLDQRD
jgi:hypothetical protein